MCICKERKKEKIRTHGRKRVKVVIGRREGYTYIHTERNKSDGSVYTSTDLLIYFSVVYYE